MLGRNGEKVKIPALKNSGRLMGKLLVLLFFQLLQILGGILVKILPAVFAAQFDFLTLVIEDNGLAHFTQFVAGDDAGVESVGFCILLLFLSVVMVMAIFGHCDRRGENSKDQSGGGYKGGDFRFHRFRLVGFGCLVGQDDFLTPSVITQTTQKPSKIPQIFS
jgi:hypothetical protein